MSKVTPPNITLADIEFNDEKDYRFKVYRTYYWFSNSMKFFAASGGLTKVNTYMSADGDVTVDIPVDVDHNEYKKNNESSVDHYLRVGFDWPRKS